MFNGLTTLKKRARLSIVSHSLIILSAGQERQLRFLMCTKTSFISQVLECPLIILCLLDAPSCSRVVCNSTHMRSFSHMHAMHNNVLHALSLSGFASYFSLSHTHTHAEKSLFPPDCFPIFLAERFMVRGMLETGYYHVLFELISQTKWSRWLRRHSRAFTATHSPPTCLPCSRLC